MNQLTCVAKEIAQLDGNDAQDNQTIDAFQNGYSAMEKMVTILIVDYSELFHWINYVFIRSKIAVITAMNCQKIVQHVAAKLTSNALIIDAFQSEYPNIYFVVLTRQFIT